MGLEFLPTSLLTPIARDLSVTEGQAGLAIAVSDFFAVITSLFGNVVFAGLDRRTVVLIHTAALAISSLVVALAGSFPVFLIGRAMVGIAIVTAAPLGSFLGGLIGWRGTRYGRRTERLVKALFDSPERRCGWRCRAYIRGDAVKAA